MSDAAVCAGAEEVLERYAATVFAAAYAMVKNKEDAEDIAQEVFISYVKAKPAFESAEHEKAWLIKVASNECRDMKRFSLRHTHTDITKIQTSVTDPESCGILEALMDISEKFRIVLILHYVEGLGVSAIADIIGKSQSAVKMRLQKGRRLLEEKYRKEYL